MSTRKRTQPNQSTAPPTTPSAEAHNQRIAQLAQARAEAERKYQASLQEAERAAKEKERAYREEEQRLQEELEAINQAEAKKKEEEEEEARKRAQEEEDARKAAEAEARRAEHAKKKEKAQTSKKREGKGKGKAIDEGEGHRERARDEVDDSDDDDKPLQAPVKSSRSKKNVFKSPVIVNNEGDDVSNEIVSGKPYPSCMACDKAGEQCRWKKGVIHLRLSLLPNKATCCETCGTKRIACKFVWDTDKTLKRPAEEFFESESSKCVKVESPEILSCLQSIDKHLGALVKYTVAHATKAQSDHEATCDMFDNIHTSLENLHEKRG